jgi:hypothetical protein
MFTSRPTEIAFALPAGFLLMPTQPWRYNVLFNDTGFLEQHVQPVVGTLSTAWFAAVQQALGGAALSTIPQQAQVQVQQASQAAYPVFSTQMPHVSAYTALNQQFYWNPGWYRILMRIETARPERSFERRWRFELSQAQSQLLRLNPIKIVQQVCQQYIGEYNFAFAPYHDAA